MAKAKNHHVVADAALRDALLNLAQTWADAATWEQQEMDNGQYAAALAQCSDDLCAAILNAQAKDKQTRWSPIDTAPKDRMLLFYGPDGVTVGCWDPGVRSHENRFPCGWTGAHRPTHWMVTPEPPAEYKSDD